MFWHGRGSSAEDGIGTEMVETVEKVDSGWPPLTQKPLENKAFSGASWKYFWRVDVGRHFRPPLLK
jgi:hypothetical protein